MISIKQISFALGQHLEGMTDCPPISWTSDDYDPDLPYLRFLHAPISRVNRSLAKDIPPDQSGLLLVTAVTQSGKFANEAEDLAEDVAARFPEGLRLAVGSGNILIDRSEPVEGLLDDRNNWTVPVRIRYRTEG